MASFHRVSAGEMIRQNINQRQCERARVVKLTTDEFFLRWNERHPELVSPEESFAASLLALEAGDRRPLGLTHITGVNRAASQLPRVKSRSRGECNAGSFQPMRGR